ncbi:MAG: ESX secretion-associated protein EspG [Sciscionella sp.]
MAGGPAEGPEELTLSTLEFDVLWEYLRLPSMPVVIGVPSPGRTHSERTRLADEAWQRIEARGLGRQINLHPLLPRYLSLLAQPEREVDGRVWVGGEVRSLAAATGQEAVHVTLAGGELTFRPISPEGLVAAVLGVLPALAAGTGHSVTLPTDDFEAAAYSAGPVRQGFALALTDRGVREADVRTLTEMISEVSGQGQFGAAARDKFGRRHRADRAVSFFDTADGRYLQVKRSQNGTPPWTTISPVDQRRLLQHVTEMLADVVRLSGG